jgi:hypothetical protein
MTGKPSVLRSAQHLNGIRLYEMTTNQPTAKPRSSAAERMRAHRQRRRDGMRCVSLEIRNSEINALICRKLLKPEMHNDLSAIIDALYIFLESNLDAKP